jgi:hypothetical protein
VTSTLLSGCAAATSTMARERAERPRGHRFSMPAARTGGAVELRVGQAAEALPLPSASESVVWALSSLHDTTS